MTREEAIKYAIYLEEEIVTKYCVELSDSDCETQCSDGGDCPYTEAIETLLSELQNSVPKSVIEKKIEELEIEKIKAHANGDLYLKNELIIEIQDFKKLLKGAKE